MSDLTYSDFAPQNEDVVFANSVFLASSTGVLRKLILSVAKSADFAQKQTARLVTLRGKTYLSFEKEEGGGKVSHVHLSVEEIESKLPAALAGYQRINLCTSLGDAELMRSKKGKITLRGVAALDKAMSSTKEAKTFISSFNREVKHYFDGTAPFLKHLGISDQNGRVYDKKQSKFRQINRFVEHLANVYGELPHEGVITVYDLCCGKSYLSFAIYAYLHDTMGREVDMLCMDLKQDVIEECAEIAKALSFNGMRFAVGDIRKLPETTKPDLVVSLHACDIATDIVIDTAIRLDAKVILSTPCCHRYINRRFDSPALAFLYRHPHFAARLGETVTDALRLLRMQKNGYKAEAAELIDLSDTPKNTILRAVKAPDFDPCSKKAKALAEEYDAALRFLLGDRANDYLKDIGV